MWGFACWSFSIRVRDRWFAMRRVRMWGLGRARNLNGRVCDVLNGAEVVEYILQEIS